MQERRPTTLKSHKTKQKQQIPQFKLHIQVCMNVQAEIVGENCEEQDMVRGIQWGAALQIL